MGMRKGRSGESPHGKNCGMKSRLAGAVRCLVHACLTAAANVGALCMKGWRWMLGAFARTRTSAKRTLTNIEGVLVTLALIATLGIASPLAAGAVEPVEDPTPVSGVLDADGAQIADAADSDDVIDESDVADSDETAKDDASADQDATEGDAADEATEDADADADASEKDASTDGEQSEGAVDGDEGVKAETTTNGIGEPKKAARAYTYDDIPEQYKDTTRSDIFAADGGSYDPLGYILSNYNVFVEDDLGSNDHKNGHIVGPIFVGQNFYNAGNIGQPNVYTHKVSSYIGGIWGEPSKGVFTDETQLKLYLNWRNYQGVHSGWIAGQLVDDILNGIPPLNSDQTTIEAYHRNVFVQDNQYVADKAAMFKNIRTQASTIASSGIQVNANDSSSDYRIENGSLILTAGKEYQISSDLLKQYNKNIILETTATIADASKLPETTIRIGGEGKQFLPSISKYRVNGEDKKFNNGEYFSGLPLVLVYPSATEVTDEDSTEQGMIFGHVVAPNAYVHHGEDYNGCVIAKSANFGAEGHMWPYNGTRLSIHKTDTFNIQAHKSLIGRQLNNQEFSFEIYKAKDKWSLLRPNSNDINWDQTTLLANTVNNADGQVDFGSIEITENDFHAGWGTIDWTQLCNAYKPSHGKCVINKTFGYVVKESIPTGNAVDSSITYDQTVFHVTVPATITFDYSVNSDDPDVTIVAGTPAYSLGSGNIDDHLQGDKPLFTNKVKTTKLKVKKEVPGGDAGDETFTFDVTLTLPYGTDPNALSGLNTTSTSSTAGKIFFDAEESHTGANGTYGYACMPNSAQTACLMDSGGIVKLPLLVDSADKIDFVDTTKFDIELVPFSQNSQVKYLKLKPKGDNKVPVSIERSSLAGTDFMGYTSVQCPADNQKQCLQKTVRVSMTAGEEKELDKLPVGTTYTVQETIIPEGFALEGYECSTNARAASTQPCSGTLQVNANGNPVQVSIVVTNKRTTVPLSIMKIVDNWQDVPQGNDQDTTFGFSVSLYDKKGNALSGPYVYKVYDENNSPVQNNAGGTLNCSTTNGSTVGTCGTLELKHNQKAVIEGLPYGTRFVVKEQTPKDPFKWDSQEVTGISSTSGCKDSDENGKCAVTSDGVLVTVHNRYELRVVLPETGGKAHPFMTMLFGVGVVCAGLLITAIYMRRKAWRCCSDLH